MPGDKPNRALTHARATVELLAKASPLAPPDIARELGIPRPSAYRLLAALVHAGLAVQTAEGQFALSTEWLRISDAALRAALEWFHGDALLQQLRESTGLTVFLSLRRENRTVCVRCLHGRNYKILALLPGGSLPLHLGGVGRITLAFGVDNPEAYLASAPFEPVTPQSLVTRDVLERDVEHSRLEGVTLSDEDVTLGVAALAVPVFGPEGSFVAALSVAGRREDVLSHVNDLSNQLKATAAAISEQV